MAVTNVFTANTQAVASEVNENFDYVDYTEIPNAKKIQWYNASSVLSAYIYQIPANNLQLYNPDGEVRIETATTYTIRLTSGKDIVLTATDDVYITGGSRLYIRNTGDTASTYIEQGTNFSIVGSASAGYFDVDMSAASGEMRLKGGTDLVLYNSGNTVSTSFIQSANLEITPSSGNIHTYSPSYDVHVRVYADDGGADYADIWHDGTNGNVSTGAGALYLNSASGIIGLRSGVDIYQYNAGNTNYGSAAYDTNWAFATTSGEMIMSPASTFRVTAGTNIVLTPGSGYDAYISAGASLFMRNPADTSATELYVDASNHYHIDPASTGSIYVHASILANAGTENLGSSANPFSTGYIGTVRSNTYDSPTGGMTFSLTLSGGFDFDASSNNEFIKVPVIAGSPSSLANGQIWYDSTAGLFKVREAGVTRTM